MSVNLRDNKRLKFKNGVIILDDVLFLHQDNKGQQQFEYMLGNKSLTKLTIENFEKNMINNNRIASVYGFDYCHFVFPAKPCVYKKMFEESGIKISNIFNDSHCQPNVIYPILSESDYDKDNTHNNDGSMIKIINMLIKRINLPELPEAIFKEIKSSGDLSRMCKFPSKKRQKFVCFRGDLEEHSNFIQRYSLADFLDGNTGHIDFIHNPSAIYEKRLILFGDSFFRGKLHIFERIFGEVIYIRNSYIVEDIIKVLEPDIVLTGNAERYLVSVPNSNKPKPLFLNYIGPHFRSSEVTPAVIEAFHALFSGRHSAQYIKFLREISSNFK